MLRAVLKLLVHWKPGIRSSSIVKQAMQRMPTLNCSPASVQTAQLVVHTFRRSRRRSYEWRRLDIVLSSPVRCYAFCKCLHQPCRYTCNIN